MEHKIIANKYDWIHTRALDKLEVMLSVIVLLISVLFFCIIVSLTLTRVGQDGPVDNGSNIVLMCSASSSEGVDSRNFTVQINGQDFAAVTRGLVQESTSRQFLIFSVTSGYVALCHFNDVTSNPYFVNITNVSTSKKTTSYALSVSPISKTKGIRVLIQTLVVS